MRLLFFIVFCLCGVAIMLALGFMVYVLCTLKRSHKPLRDATLAGLSLVTGGYLLSQWLVVFVMVAPFYIPAL